MSKPIQTPTMAVPIQYAVGQIPGPADGWETFAASSVDYGKWGLVTAGTPAEVCAALPPAAVKSLSMRCSGD